MTLPTDHWRGVYRNTLLVCLALIAIVIAAQRHADLVERDAKARADFLRHTDTTCLPLRKGESSVMINTNGQLRCRTYANTGYGMAPRLVSAVVMDVPPL